ncbi:PQQ-dependent sugar dehydrogenase [Imtechella halotolerans]|nr:PQQ-dependent sugar dehydrogenase [Imtechella halotolerans]WMQ64462.1 PQQ-dependent sugar dehydrogenase [Imtechella halotolerans]
MKLIQLMVIMFTMSFTLVSCAQQKEQGPILHTPLENSFDLQPVVEGLNIPWGMAFLPDGSLLVTEKEGNLIHVKNNSKTIIKGVPEVYLRGQGGLLDIALHPNYKDNGWIYLTYALADGQGSGGNTALMRAKIDNNTLVSHELLYKATPNTTKGVHFGSRITFDNDGYLYFSIGDRGDHDLNPQDLSRDGGKIYRLHDDGQIPVDNPFFNTSDAKKAVYSYGHRNPQGMIKHPETGAIWTHEHGPKGGDEINIIKKGKNYGWPIITYGINYSGTPITDVTEMEGMEQPLYYWVPSIAPSGMAFVTSSVYPQWKGSLLVGSLSFQYLERLEIKDNKVVSREKLLVDIGRVRNVVQGPDGYIYVAIEGTGIVKLVPKK